MSSDCTCDCTIALDCDHLPKSSNLSPSSSSSSAQESNVILRHIAASALGSLIAVSCLNPVSVVKVKLQSTSSNLSLSEVVQSVYRQRGLLGFWSGASIGLLQAVPSTVLYMTFYERIKAQLNVSNAVPGGLAPGIAGGLARCVSVSVISPLELVRTIQTGGSKDSATSIIKRIFVSNGVAGLYRGWWSSIMRDAPFSSIYWYSFEFFKDTCIAVTNKRSGTNNHIVNFLSGSAAGIVAAIVTHPFDVLKTQQQLSAGGSSTGSTAVLSVSSPSTLSMSVTNSILSPNPNPTTHSHSTLTMPPTILRLYQQGGVSALYRGLTMRLATVIPSSAIMVTVYEGVKNWNIE